MLRVLELKDFAIIDELMLELSSGFNVLTGETGAGKSIVVDALALLSGERADSSFVRTGASSALIQGLYDKQSDGLSASRRLATNKRHTARLDGEIVPVAELKAVLQQEIAIYAQHAAQSLLSPLSQRSLLDRMLSQAGQRRLQDYQQRYRDYQDRQRELARLHESIRERARRLDILRYQVAEIDEAKLEVGEEEQLLQQVAQLRHAERIVQAGSAAHLLLSEHEENALSLLAEAQRQLEQAGRYSPDVAALAAELSEVNSSVQAISGELDSFLSGFDMDPQRLDELEQRLALIEKLKLKYGDAIEAILDYQQERLEELHQLEQADASLVELEGHVKHLALGLERIAKQLFAERRKAGQQLAQEMTRKLSDLALPKARFEIAVDWLEGLTADGQDRVEFLFSANLGETLAPLREVASGGELSRIMLALHVVTGADVPTLVFDEVDAGIGGETGLAVGRLLKTLAKNHQVLVVTHLAQVAAFADTHFVVSKEEQQGRTVTRVRALAAEEREVELARMLSGTVTAKAREHARELIHEVAQGKQSALA